MIQQGAMVEQQQSTQMYVHISWYVLYITIVMETFSNYRSCVKGMHRWPVNSITNDNNADIVSSLNRMSNKEIYQTT